MVSMTKAAENRGLRILAMGYPGNGKTGALAALANAGYNLRILDFDNNLEPLFQYIDPKARDRVDIQTLEDDLVKDNLGPVKVKGTPKAFARGLDLINNWVHTGDDPTTTDPKKTYGSIYTWGPKDILVVDSLTGVGEAAMARTLTMQNRSVLNRRIQDWGLAAAEQLAFIRVVTNHKVKCHVYVTCHLKMISPKEVEDDDEDTNKDLRARVAQVVPTKLFPAAIGQQLPQAIAGEFPIALLFESEAVGERQKRIIRTVPSPAVDVKLPAVDMPTKLPLETGLLTIFENLTATAKGEKRGKVVSKA